MFVSDSLGVNESGNLTIGGLDTVSLAEKYGTPLYVMDEDEIRGNLRRFKTSMDKYYKGHGLVAYASKAFNCLAMCKIAAEEGVGLDIVSGGELHTALRAGFPAEKMFFHGNNKTSVELAMAVENGVGRIVVDNVSELMVLNAIAKAAGKKANILFRIKPGIDAHTHDFVRTGQIDSKFGLALETGEALEAVRQAASLDGVMLKGLHCHIGSQIFDIDPFVHAAEVMISFIAQIKQETGMEIEQLNLGGGFGIKYLGSDDPAPYEEYMRRVSGAVEARSKALGVKEPYIIIEPGRSIVGPAGITLYRVGAVKEIPGVRTYVSVDGGMTDNPRYALYHSEYEAMIANRAGRERSAVVTVAGKCCESGDLLGEGMHIQPCEAGDILAVLATGAYNYSMSSNYNRVPRPAVVMVKGGEAREVVKRETFDDLIRNDVL